MHEMKMLTNLLLQQYERGCSNDRKLLIVSYCLFQLIRSCNSQIMLVSLEASIVLWAAMTDCPAIRALIF